jgi:hypothetical protein
MAFVDPYNTTYIDAGGDSRVGLSHLCGTNWFQRFGIEVGLDPRSTPRLHDESIILGDHLGDRDLEFDGFVAGDDGRARISWSCLGARSIPIA